MDALSVSFGDFVKFKRIYKKLSNLELAKMINVSDSYVYKLERNEMIPSLKIFADICRVLEFSNTEIVWIIRAYKELSET